MKQALATTGAMFGMIALGSCAPVDESARSYADTGREGERIDLVGEPLACVSISRIRSTSVRGDGVIDFTIGGESYRNILRSGCPALREDDAITYEVRGGQLCRGEIVYALDNYGGRLERGPGCSLGKFQRIEFVESISDAPPIMSE